MRPVTFRLDHDWSTDKITLRMRAASDHGGGYWMATEQQWAPMEENTQTRPSLFLDKDEAQQLMDELWRIGARPTEGSGSAGSLAATERHLRDMQAIVKKTLELP